MAVIISILIVVAIVWLFGSSSTNTSKESSKTSGPKKKPVIKMLNREGDVHEDEWHTYIAGLPHHVSKYDVGGFSGWVENDFNNAHDASAMGVYNSYGKLLGYIPAKELDDYRLWCDTMVQPCVGFIYVEDGQYRGRVKILRPCNKDFLQTEFNRYLQWVSDNYGNDYLPKHISMNFDIN